MTAGCGMNIGGMVGINPPALPRTRTKKKSNDFEITKMKNVHVIYIERVFKIKYLATMMGIVKTNFSVRKW